MSYAQWASAVWTLIGSNPKVQQALAQGGGCNSTSAEDCLFIAYGDAAYDTYSTPRAGLGACGRVKRVTPQQAARQALAGLWA